MGTVKILLIGYGNPGRLDDGLGPALAERIEQLGIAQVSVDANYQLTVEDAAAVAAHDVVIFADAALKGRTPFFFRRVAAQKNPRVDSHALAPEAVLGLARRVFGAKTRGFVLGIRGYEFNAFGQRLSAAARQNLARAEEFVAGILRDPEFFSRNQRRVSKPQDSVMTQGGSGAKPARKDNNRRRGRTGGP